MIETRVVDVPAEPGAKPAQIAVHTCGQGPLAILLHGFPLDHRMWLDVMHGELGRRRTLSTFAATANRSLSVMMPTPWNAWPMTWPSSSAR